MPIRSFFEPVTPTSFRVFFRQEDQKLLYADEFVNDPVTESMLVLTGEYPDPNLHNAKIGEVTVGFYELDPFMQSVCLRGLYQQWMLRYMDTATLIVSLGKVLASVTNLIPLRMRVTTSLVGSAPDEVSPALLLEKRLRTLMKLIGTFPDPEFATLREDTTAFSMLQGVSDLVLSTYPILQSLEVN